jgi:hypothetical protein
MLCLQKIIQGLYAVQPAQSTLTIATGLCLGDEARVRVEPNGSAWH